MPHSLTTTIVLYFSYNDDSYLESIKNWRILPLLLGCVIFYIAFFRWILDIRIEHYHQFDFEVLIEQKTPMKLFAYKLSSTSASSSGTHTKKWSWPCMRLRVLLLSKIIEKLFQFSFKNSILILRENHWKVYWTRQNWVRPIELLV